MKKPTRSTKPISTSSADKTRRPPAGGALAIIPARAGSKRIHQKNIAPLAGKPLIAWTIEQALASKRLARVIVSTDSEEIRAVALRCGAEAPFLRPAKLAKDDTPTWPVLRHALEWIESAKSGGRRPDPVVLLQPTSPLRQARDIDVCIDVFVKNDCEAVISVCKSRNNPYYDMVEMDGDGFLVVSKRVSPQPLRSQDAPPVYVFNGAVYVFSRAAILEYENQFCLRTILPYVMPEERSLDIDEPGELEAAAEKISAQRRK